MGREVKRVPLDFGWPLEKTWKGYLMPDKFDEAKCPDCDGDGYTVEARAIANTFYPHQIGYGPEAAALAWCDKIGQAEVDNLVKAGRLRVWEDGEWVKKPRTAAEINAENGPRRGLDGHDAINRGILVEFRCKRLGITLYCKCKGHGTVEKYPGQRAEAEKWESTEPPKGDGWQLWETVSEGSPISPVFDTPEELARFLADNPKPWAMDRGTTYETWLRFITGPGWAPSMVSDANGLRSGVEGFSGGEGGSR